METTQGTGKAQCDEKVYRGSQYERLVGKPCTRQAAVRLVAPFGGRDRDMCEQHAQKLERESGYERRH